MKKRLLKNSFFVSALWHLAAFGVFSLSFGPRIPAVNDTPVSFWSTVLSGAQVRAPLGPKPSASLLFNKPVGLVSDKAEKPKPHSFDNYYLKPFSALSFSPDKEGHIKSPVVLSLEKRAEPELVFHPSLPYDFKLYFNDRQSAHVELMFKAVPERSGKSIQLERNVSSGNLEVDLLIMRYIGHYLFMQQAWITPNKWQTVKIDLSAKND